MPHTPLNSNLTTESTPASTHPKPRDLEEAVIWARKLLAKTDWVIIDTETTGLGKTAEVIQIGILDWDGSVLLDTYVKPVHRKRIPSDATAIHGITMKMLSASPTWPELLPKLSSIMKGKQWAVIYNAEYDRRLMQQTTEKNCTVPFQLNFNTYCAMMTYSQYVGEWNHKYNDYTFQKLPGSDHSAIGDCRATLALIHRMAQTDIPERISFIAKLLKLLGVK